MGGWPDFSGLNNRVCVFKGHMARFLCQGRGSAAGVWSRKRGRIV
jgi:hypothetical protein